MKWQEADWGAFLKALTADLQPTCSLATTTEMDATVNHLIRTIQQSAEGTVPVAKIAPYSTQDTLLN